jgi:hypothetical protein
MEQVLNGNFHDNVDRNKQEDTQQIQFQNMFREESSYLLNEHL